MPFPSLTRHLLGLATVVLTAGFFATSAQAGVIVQAPKYVGLDKGLVGWWPFDGKSVAGNHAYDASGNGNRGTLSTTAVPPTAACPGGTDTYSTAGTFSWPSSWSGLEGCTSVNIQAWGNGGAYSAGAVSVTNGTSYTVIVGAGGTTADAAGGDNSFNDTSTILAKGGSRTNAATGGSGGQASSGVGTTRTSGGAGGNATTGNPSAGGGGGCSGTATADGGNRNAASGGTGCTSSPGAGGNGGNNGVDGTAGTAPGGGGGGRLLLLTAPGRSS